MENIYLSKTTISFYIIFCYTILNMRDITKIHAVLVAYERRKSLEFFVLGIKKANIVYIVYKKPKKIWEPNIKSISFSITAVTNSKMDETIPSTKVTLFLFISILSTKIV
ncbi:hypothetical protein PFDG_00752 [Plasmodium falciparum Dd2]|uniref:Uncharacterized protein n=1 Tax=Plasmodium falciparum (isolate Dd2) TaxID=57267 RepID=A0A0L7LXH2_PLAF4|nr:hypothetical protein PFDG_00752 [Plasmodium falciparum Dd2]